MSRQKTGASFGMAVAKLAVTVGFTALVMAGARGSVAAFYRVAHNSNAPTFFVGDFALANLAAYDLRLPYTELVLLRWGAPQQGDMVLVRLPQRSHILAKRVVGVGGDIVTLRDNELLINGVPASYEQILDQPQTGRALSTGAGDRILRETVDGVSRTVRRGSATSPVADFGPIVVPDQHYFVMGDNRDISYDSRFEGCGPVPRDAILGKVVAKLALTG